MPGVGAVEGGGVLQHVEAQEVEGHQRPLAVEEAVDDEGERQGRQGGEEGHGGEGGDGRGRGGQLEERDGQPAQRGRGADDDGGGRKQQREEIRGAQ